MTPDVKALSDADLDAMVARAFMVNDSPRWHAGRAEQARRRGAAPQDVLEGGPIRGEEEDR